MIYTSDILLKCEDFEKLNLASQSIRSEFLATAYVSGPDFVRLAIIDPSEDKIKNAFDKIAAQFGQANLVERSAESGIPEMTIDLGKPTATNHNQIAAGGPGGNASSSNHRDATNINFPTITASGYCARNWSPDISTSPGATRSSIDDTCTPLHDHEQYRRLMLSPEHR